MRISDWSSDVCSSDLFGGGHARSSGTGIWGLGTGEKQESRAIQINALDLSPAPSPPPPTPTTFMPFSPAFFSTLTNPASPPSPRKPRRGCPRPENGRAPRLTSITKAPLLLPPLLGKKKKITTVNNKHNIYART